MNLWLKFGKKKFIVHGETWVASILHFKVTKRIIIKGIDDSDMDLSLLLENMRSSGNWSSYWESPIKIEKLKKRIPDPNAKDKFIYIETNATIATFSNFPSYAIVLEKRVYLNPFLQKVQRCLHCQRFGHNRRICKDIKLSNICYKCGQKDHEANACSKVQQMKYLIFYYYGPLVM